MNDPIDAPQTPECDCPGIGQTSTTHSSQTVKLATIRTQSVSGRAETCQALDRACLLMIEKLGEKITLQDMADAACMSSGAVHFRVFGPTGHRGKGDQATFPSTSRFIDLLFGSDGAFSYLRDFAAPTTIDTTDIDASAVAPRAPKTIYSEHGLNISAIAGHHGDAPAVIYRIDYRNQSITFSGDIDALGIDNLRRLAGHSSLLVFNCVVLDPPGSRPVLYTLHTPPLTIGEVAADSETSKLLLSHLSPSIDENRNDVEASIRSHYKGQVVFAKDGMRLSP